MEFMRSTPIFEKLLVQSGTILVKYWMSLSDEEQLFRIKSRVNNPLTRWKTVGGSLDVQNLDKWDAFTKAKDIMF